MQLVRQLHVVTSELYELLRDNVIHDDSRDEMILKVEQLLEDRQVLLTKLKGPFSREEQELGLEMVKMNNTIDERLKRVQKEIQTDMNKVKKQKVSNEKYTNPYKNVNFDGMFFDKKK